MPSQSASIRLRPLMLRRKSFKSEGTTKLSLRICQCGCPFGSFYPV